MKKVVDSAINEKPVKKFLQGNAIQVLGILVILLNLWLATKLSPLQQNLAVIVEKVEALEESTEKYVQRTEIETSLDDIKDRLERIENKL